MKWSTRLAALAVGAVLLLIQWPAFAGESPTAPAVTAPDGVPLAYGVFGDPANPAVVLIHGWSCDRTYWDGVVGRLAAGHFVLAVDLAGHGQSGQQRANYTMDAFGGDVAALVQAFGLEKAVLVGHSMGGTVMLAAADQLAGKVEVAGLVGIDTLHEPRFGFTGEMADNFLQPMRADFPGFTDGFVRSMFPKDADQKLVSRVAADMGSAPPGVGVSAMYNLLTYEAGPVLERLTAPIVCLDAPVWPVDRQAWEFYGPGYEVVIMKGVGHFPMLEKPAEFGDRLEEIMARF